MSWNAGYVSDVAYVANYTPGMSPAWLRMAALSARQLPPEITGHFRYLDLGCGYATTLLPLAAANPQAEFVGVDFMPEHVAFANRVIQRTGLKNAQVLESAFGDIAQNPALLGGPFDFIVMHGVYTWVSPQTQQEIISILRTHLKPGGLCYVGYNTHPGWTRAVPLQHILSSLAGQFSGSSIERVTQALRILARLKAANAPVLKDIDLPPSMKEALENIDGLSPWVAAYLAHEYLNEHWRPVFIAELCEALAEAKLTFCGSTRMIEHSDSTGWTDDQKSLIAEFTNPVAAESIKEMLMASGFRRDLFVRGPTRLETRLQMDQIASTEFALVVPAKEVTPEFGFREHVVKINEALAASLAAALADGPQSVAQILEKIPASLHGTDAVGIAGLLMDVGIALPVLPKQSRLATAVDFNMAYIAESKDTIASQHIGLVSPVLGAARAVPMNRVIAYQWLVRGRPIMDGFPDELVELADQWEPIFKNLGML